MIVGLLIAIGVLLIFGIGLQLYSINIKITTNKNYQKLISQNDTKNKLTEIAYTKQMIAFIRELTIEIATFKFEQFLNNRKVETITRESLKNLIDKVSTSVYDCIDKESINFDHLLMTEAMYDNYIIETSIYVINDLFERRIRPIMEH